MIIALTYIHGIGRTKALEIADKLGIRKRPDGKYLWPCYGDNVRILKWIVERCEGTAEAIESPIGRIPANGALDVSGLDISSSALTKLLHVYRELWLREAELNATDLAMLGSIPPGISEEQEKLELRLAVAVQG